MIGVVVATHGRLAQELLRTAEGVLGAMAKIKAIGIEASQADPCGELGRAIDAMDEGQGVLVLTDLFGGSPTNLCLGFLGSRHVEVITGVNLPMLLKVSSLRKDGVALEALAQSLTRAAQASITLLSERLKETGA